MNYHGGSDDEELVNDRDVSTPKNKMKIRIKNKQEVNNQIKINNKKDEQSIIEKSQKESINNDKSLNKSGILKFTESGEESEEEEEEEEEEEDNEKEFSEEENKKQIDKTESKKEEIKNEKISEDDYYSNLNEEEREEDDNKKQNKENIIEKKENKNEKIIEKNEEKKEDNDKKIEKEVGKKIEKINDERKEEKKNNGEEKGKLLQQKTKEGKSTKKENNIEEEKTMKKQSIVTSEKKYIKLCSKEKIPKQNAQIQVNLITENYTDENEIVKKLKKEIVILKNENLQKIIELEKEIKQKNDEIIKKDKEILQLSNINTKLRKNYEIISKKLDNILKEKTLKLNTCCNKKNILSKRNVNIGLNPYHNKINKNDANNENNNLIDLLNIKDNQIKDNLSTIMFLKKDNLKLKDTINYIKDQHLEELDRDFMSKSNIRYFNNQILSLKTSNHKKQQEISDLRYEIKNLQEKNSNNNTMQFNDKEMMKKRVGFANSVVVHKMNMEGKRRMKLTNNSISCSNIFDRKNNNNNNNNDNDDDFFINIKRVFDDNERQALCKLFTTEEEFRIFDEKVRILQNMNDVNTKKLKMKIKELLQEIEEKDEQIYFLRETNKRNEMKISILRSQVNIENNLKKKEDKYKKIVNELEETFMYENKKRDKNMIETTSDKMKFNNSTKINNPNNII